MKRTIILLFSVLFFSLSCSVKQDTASILGTWTLTESLSDPGDGSGRWTPATQISEVEFKPDGTISSTGFGDFVRYKIVDTNQVEFTRKDGSKLLYRYKLGNDLLELNPPCIEACGFRFKRKPQ